MVLIHEACWCDSCHLDYFSRSCALTGCICERCAECCSGSQAEHRSGGDSYRARNGAFTGIVCECEGIHSGRFCSGDIVAEWSCSRWWEVGRRYGCCNGWGSFRTLGYDQQLSDDLVLLDHGSRSCRALTGASRYDSTGDGKLFAYAHHAADPDLRAAQGAS